MKILILRIFVLKVWRLKLAIFLVWDSALALLSRIHMFITLDISVEVDVVIIDRNSYLEM